MDVVIILALVPPVIPLLLSYDFEQRLIMMAFTIALSIPIILLALARREPPVFHVDRERYQGALADALRWKVFSNTEITGQDQGYASPNEPSVIHLDDPAVVLTLGSTIEVRFLRSRELNQTNVDIIDEMLTFKRR